MAVGALPSKPHPQPAMPSYIPTVDAHPQQNDAEQPDAFLVHTTHPVLMSSVCMNRPGYKRLLARNMD